MMSHDIEFEVIGNTSPFSLMGESSCYLITVNGRSYLLDCGTPIFPYLGYQGISEIKGIFATHSHEDHKRWFTDIVLFSFYNPVLKSKVRLVSSETILDEYAKNSKGALERTLSFDSKKVIDVPYENMVEPIVIGPRSKYFINLKKGGSGFFYYQVEDRQGNVIGPDKAKIFINPAATRPRLLYNGLAFCTRMMRRANGSSLKAITVLIPASFTKKTRMSFTMEKQGSLSRR